MKLKYRCRLCGAEFGGASADTKIITEALMVLSCSDYYKAGHVISIREIHYCDGNKPINHIGLADLIGAEEETKGQTS